MSLLLPLEIETSASLVLDALNKESIDVYRFLSERYLSVDPGADAVFQFMFRSFYRLDNAGLTPKFKQRYFDLMQDAKEAGRADLVSIVKELWKFPNRKGQQSLQFSFATKLAATVDPRLPIYDAEVASLFGFQPPHPSKPFEVRLDTYLSFYCKLRRLYEQTLTNNQLNFTRTLFREKFTCNEAQVSEQKALDFIFWAAGKRSKARAQ
ncbi:hypothetical protein [Silvimonas amylolytica]|uniref:Uncharacterized protein n=1 Tax=Silvimonas amylolytica TaxID=449663 RepID=A0ABQ2PMZ6_9NEIS|nr:hypothetical protein [Silvimonas amylolytica]GGP26837.1 hypothetical protein GCM10010971_26560 [Silvimonas amylolytica]